MTIEEAVPNRAEDSNCSNLGSMFNSIIGPTLIVGLPRRFARSVVGEKKSTCTCLKFDPVSGLFGMRDRDLGFNAK